MNMIDEFPEVLDAQQLEIIETAKTLNTISYQIAELVRIKSELDKRMVALCEHGSEGQRTYLKDIYKITIKTGINYSLDKEKYEVLSRHLNSSIDPVRKVTKYELDKKILKQSYLHASEKELQILDELITKNEAKISVVIKAGI